MVYQSYTTCDFFRNSQNCSRKPNWTIHPGEILADELEELAISAAELARLLHVPANRITQILNGKRAITADTALRLGQWLGTGPELWLNLQQTYDLRITNEERGAQIRQTITPRLVSYERQVIAA